MILADAGPLVALFNDRDTNHRLVRAFVQENREPISIPSCVVGEVGHLLEGRATTQAEATFLRFLGSGPFVIEDPERADYLRAADLVERYADFPLGTIDSLIVAMAERLRVSTLLTLDRRHFRAVRPSHCSAFSIVP